MRLEHLAPLMLTNSVEAAPLLANCNVPPFIPAADTQATLACVFDVLIAVAYFAIPLQLVYFLKSCPRIPAKHVVVLFILFIFLCGMSHMITAWMAWWPTHTFLLVIKCLTALVSLVTTTALFNIIPKALALPLYARSMEMEVSNRLISERSLMRKNLQLDKLRKVTFGLRHTLNASAIIDSLSRDLLLHMDVHRCVIYAQRSAVSDYALLVDRQRHDGRDPYPDGDEDDTADTTQLLQQQQQHDSASVMVNGLESAHEYDEMPCRPILPTVVVETLASHGRPERYLPGSTQLCGLVGTALAEKHYGIAHQFADSRSSYLILLLFDRDTVLDGHLDDVQYLMEDLSEQVAIALEQAELMENERRRTKQMAEINTALVQARREVDNFHAQREFLAVMSHEMRTPLFATSALSSILVDSPLLKRNVAEFAEMSEMLRVIQMSNEMLIGIVNNILDFTKYESEKFHLEEEPFSLRDAIETAIEIVCVQDEMSKFPAVNYFIDSHVPESVIGDFTRFRQIAVNLINNACKFTDPSGSVKIMLNIVESSDDDDRVHIRLEIQDTGIGIADEAISRLYEKFFQADRSITRQYGGTGLGLAIVKRLTELMDGHIQVKSAPNTGTSFTIIMAFKTLSSSDDSGKSRLPVTVAPAYRFPVESLRNVNVAYVDNNTANREGFSHLMATLGVNKVYHADNIYKLAMECQQMGSDISFQAVVIDLATVQKNGCFPLLCSLLESVSTKNLLITGNASHHRQWRSLSLPEGVSVSCMIRPIKARPMEKFFQNAHQAINIADVIRKYDLPALTPVDTLSEGIDPISKSFLQAMCSSVHRNNAESNELCLSTSPPEAPDELTSSMKASVLSSLRTTAKALEQDRPHSSASSQRPPSLKLAPVTRALSFSQVMPIKIMVAEDNPINQMVIGKMLGQLGYTFTLVNNGQEAINAFEENQTFDIIFMDIMMPIKDGFQASAEIRQLYKALANGSASSRKSSVASVTTAGTDSASEPPKIQATALDSLAAGSPPTRPWIIALTANAFWDDRVRCLDAGMNDFVAKPAKLADLRDAIARYTESTSVQSPRVTMRPTPLKNDRYSVAMTDTSCTLIATSNGQPL